MVYNCIIYYYKHTYNLPIKRFMIKKIMNVGTAQLIQFLQAMLNQYLNCINVYTKNSIRLTIVYSIFKILNKK